MPKLIDLTGKEFGRWLVHYRAGTARNGAVLWKCKCSCGTEKLIVTSELVCFRTLSCGCARNHGMSKIPEYQVWLDMKHRCNNKNNPAYKHYGGRGISVCKRWSKSFQDFYKDMGNKPTKKHSIDRIDNNGNYEPGNCRWATWKVQAVNKRPKRFNANKLNGVYRVGNQLKWKVQITKNNQQKHLGYFDDFFDACCARKSAENKLD